MATDIKPTEINSCKLPDIYLKKFNDVCIRGNSDMVIDINNGFLINEKAYNTDHREKILDGVLYRVSENIGLICDSLRHGKKIINSGIMISGKFCNNYYHVMFENLIRLIYIERVNIPKNVPIIIDEKTMNIPSCKKIFDILTERIDRKIITINDDSVYHIHELYYIDHINEIPAHSRDVHNPFIAIYSPEAIKYLKEKLIKFKSKDNFYKRIFISRKNTKRRNYNEDEVYNVLKNYNFVRIYPEKYSFEEQMAIFNNAEFIVSSSGAALTNLLFINNACTVICFGRSSYDKVSEVPVFNTIAAINGARFYFFPRKNRVIDSIHENFVIDCSDFEKLIKKIFE